MKKYPMNFRTRMLSILPVVLALVLGACAGQTSQEPPPANTQAAPAASDPAPTTTQAEQPADPAPEASPTLAEAPETGSGTTYRIVPGDSQISYEVGETFLDQNNKFATAIGITGVISGEIHIDTANPQASSLGTFTVDISQFKSDSSRRDNAIRQRFIQTSRYPIVTFIPTQIEGLPASYTAGQEITFKVTGDVTIREATRPLTFDVSVKLDGDTLSGTATTSFLMSDYGFGPISMVGILNTEDQVKIIFNITAKTG
jgi:polyisoprenoid-binding protein YceI